jgi:hypothetical protein
MQSTDDPDQTSVQVGRLRGACPSERLPRVPGYLWALRRTMRGKRRLRTNRASRSDEVVRTIERMTPTLEAMVRLQLASAMRPVEENTGT